MFSPVFLSLLLFVGTGAGYYQLGIGVYILNIADINVVAGSFYADYLLTIYKDGVQHERLDQLLTAFKSNNHRTCSIRSESTRMRQLRPLNYTADDIFLVNVDRDYNFLPVLGVNASLLGQHRVMGVHYFRPQLKDWPFESEKLPIIIDLSRQVATSDTSAVVCHMPEFSGVSSGVMFPGGSSDTLSFDFVTLERCWPPFVYPTAQCGGSNFGTSDCECPSVEDNDTLEVPHVDHDDFSCRCKGGKYLSSEYQFSVFYNTPKSSGFQRDILPVVFILIVNLISYLIPPEENSLRVSTCSSTLISAVLFHSSLQSELPPTSSLSRADVFLLVYYGVNLVSWIVALTIVVSIHSPLIKRYQFHERVYYLSRIFGPILSISVVSVFPVYHKHSLWWLLVISLTSGTLLSTMLCVIQSRVIVYLRKTKLKQNITRYDSQPNWGQSEDPETDEDDVDANTPLIQLSDSQDRSTKQKL